MPRDATHSTHFGRNFIILIVAIGLVVGTVMLLIDAHLRPGAPLLLFVILGCCVQMFLGRIPVAVATVGGAALFLASALLDPLVVGRMRLQELTGRDWIVLFLGGAATGRLGAVLMTGLFEAAQRMQRGQEARTYAVPRRFSTGTVLLATTCFAALFGVLNYSRARPWELFFYASFVATVSLFQAIFQRSPRWASILAGGVFLPLSMLLYGSPSRRSILPRIRLSYGWDYDEFLVATALIGLLIGYLGGALVAGMFLVSDYVMRLLSSSPTPRVASEPVEADLPGGSSLSALAERAVAARRLE